MLDSCRAMENEGFSVTYLPVQNNGIIDLKVDIIIKMCALFNFTAPSTDLFRN